MVRARLGASILFATALGCSLGPIDFDQKECPCYQGFVCHAGRCCEPIAVAADFRAAWVTSTSIRWAWTPPPDPTGFVRYEVVVAESEADVVARSGTARVFGPEVNPELGGYVLPRTEGTQDLVTGTTSDGLRPSTSYFAQLSVFDVEGCPWRSEIVSVQTTLDPPATIHLYRDDPVGNPWPSNFEVVPDPEGGSRLEWQSETDPFCGDADVCGGNLRRQDFEVSVAAIPRGAFESNARTAMLEMHATHDSPTPSFYSRVWLRFGTPATCGDRVYRFEPFTLRAATVGSTVEQLIQVPLAELTSDDGRLTYEELTSVCEFNLGGNWLRGSTVWVDDVRIRY